jgi:hypothetical protein
MEERRDGSSEREAEAGRGWPGGRAAGRGGAGRPGGRVAGWGRVKRKKKNTRQGPNAQTE